MNFKKYFLINLKQYLVLYIVSFALFTSMAISAVLSFTMYTSVYAQCPAEVFNETCVTMPDYDMSLLDMGILGIFSAKLSPILFMLFILMLILPLFAMGARYSLTASDTYKQVSQRRNAIRLTNNLTLLSAVLIIFTIVYWGMVIAIAIRHHTYKLPETEWIELEDYIGEEVITYYQGTIYEKVNINYGIFGIAYPIILVTAALQYFISYLFVSRANRAINSVLCLVMGEFLLMFLMFALLRYINIFYAIDHFGDALVEPISGTGNSSAFLPMMFVIQLFDPLITGGKTAFDNIEDPQKVVLAVSLAIYLSLAGLGIFAMIFDKDPSGEYAGKPESPKPYQEIVFHSGALGIGLGVGALLSALSPIATGVVLVVLIILYYVFLGIFRRNFKINLKNLIPYLAISSIVLAMGLISSLVYYNFVK